METIKWEKCASIALCLAAGIALFILFFRIALPIFTPFLAAWLLSLCVRPCAKKCARKSRGSYSVFAVSFLILLLFLFGFFLRLLLLRIWKEAEELVTSLLRSEQLFSFDFFDSVISKIRFLQKPEIRVILEDWHGEINRFFTDLLNSILSSVAATLPSLASGILSAAPDVVFGAVVTVVAAFYFAASEKGVFITLSEKLPEKYRKITEKITSFGKRFSWKYLRAYLLILSITFGELLAGFLILRVPYALLLSLLIAVIDFFPILGTGTVLIPWGIYAIFTNHAGLGVGLLILYAVTVIVRQVMEPHIIGKSFGIPALLTLFAAFAGWKLAGFWGLLLAPLVLVLGKAFRKTN